MLWMNRILQEDTKGIESLLQATHPAALPAGSLQFGQQRKHPAGDDEHQEEGKGTLAEEVKDCLKGDVEPNIRVKLQQVSKQRNHWKALAHFLDHVFLVSYTLIMTVMYVMFMP